MLYLTSVKEARVETPAAMLEDQLTCIAGGSPDALAALYHETRGAVYGLALSILKNTYDAEDVLHDCYVQIHAGAHRYRANGKPMAWILTIARNLSYMKLRERKKTTDLPQEDWETTLAFGPAVSGEDRLVLAECMERLSDEERQIVFLHALAGLKHREIAQLLELPLPTVLSKYNRALKKLKQYLSKGERNE